MGCNVVKRPGHVLAAAPDDDVALLVGGACTLASPAALLHELSLPCCPRRDHPECHELLRRKGGLTAALTATDLAQTVAKETVERAQVWLLLPRTLAQACL